MKRFEQDEKMMQGPNGYIGSEVESIIVLHIANVKFLKSRGPKVEDFETLVVMGCRKFVNVKLRQCVSSSMYNIVNA